MDSRLIWISLLIVGVLAVILYLIIREVKNEKEKKQTEPPPPDPFAAPIDVTCRATVVDLACTVRSEGTKEPRTVKKFVICFATEEQPRLLLSVPEHYYTEFEKGRTGTLTLVDGAFYSFEAEEDPSLS